MEQKVSLLEYWGWFFTGVCGQGVQRPRQIPLHPEPRELRNVGPAAWLRGGEKLWRRLIWIKTCFCGLSPHLVEEYGVGISPVNPVLSLLLLCWLEPGTLPLTPPVSPSVKWV